jgi:hypothetical protein
MGQQYQRRGEQQTAKKIKKMNTGRELKLLFKKK